MIKNCQMRNFSDQEQQSYVEQLYHSVKLCFEVIFFS